MAGRLRVGFPLLLATLVVVIMFIPIRRYAMPFNLPFQLEPYRIVVLLILCAWVASLLVDPRIRLRRSGLEGPLVAMVIATVLSLVSNPGHVSDYESAAIKSLTFFLSFLLVFYCVVSVVRSMKAVDLLTATLVSCGLIVAVFAIVESRTGFNAFDRIQSVFPLVRFTGDDTLTRGGNFRATGPAEHPIALGALLVLLLPLALYRAMRFRKPLWWISLVAITVGATATVSRTAVAMLLATAAVYFMARPRQTLKLAPLLVPFLVVAHFSTPGTLGALKASFTSEKASNAGRTSDYSPAMDQFSASPLFGQGAGTRITTGLDQNAEVLDNQWLGTLLETGLVGVAALAWLVLRFVRRLLTAARHCDDPDAWLLIGLASACTAWATGMFLFDAFSFVQASFVLYFCLALGSVLVTASEPLLRPVPRAPVDEARATVEMRGGSAGRPGPQVVAPL